MGVITYDMKITSPAPPAKMFKAYAHDCDILQHAVTNIEFIEGEGDVGTITVVHFDEGGQFKSLKQRVDGIDKENFIYSYSILKGDLLMEVVESISFNIKIEVAPDGGCIWKNSSKYHTKGDAQITDEQIKSCKEYAMAMLKDVEAYILENPDTYNYDF